MYNGFIPDLTLFAEDKTMEGVISEASKLMTYFFKLVVKYQTEIPEPSSLEATCAKWKGYKVMYVVATVK